MSAVWRAARAAVRRRRLQSVVIGLVVLCSTTTVMLALGLLDAVSAPFDQAFGRQHGAHVVATYDRAGVSAAGLAEAARRPGVQAAEGPFGQGSVKVVKGWPGFPAGTLKVVGRADPAGAAVDRPALLAGRWAAAPGELVLNQDYTGLVLRDLLGTRIDAPGSPPLTVVGLATSMSRSADAWVVPEQIGALHPDSVQMLYRFAAAGTAPEVAAAVDAVTAGLPAGALVSAQSHLTLKEDYAGTARDYLPFMTLFGALGLAVSVLIVGNVVGGAVVSGFRHIGVLKALGFTPNQVVAVYLVMVSLPAVAGAALGTLAGGLLAEPVLDAAFQGVRRGAAVVGIAPWVSVTCLLGMPALALLAALVPALRAHRLSAAQAISAGSAPRAGRGLAVQRRLGGSRLPRPVSLGLGHPFARPARTALTLAAVLLGVATVTLTTGLTSTMLAYSGTQTAAGGPEVVVWVGRPALGETAPRLGDRELESLVRSRPGVTRVTAHAVVDVRLAGFTQPDTVFFQRGDDDPGMAAQVVSGRWLAGPGEVVAAPQFLKQHGLAVGDRTSMELEGRRTPVTVVGELISGGGDRMWSAWPTLAALAPEAVPVDYQVELAPGTDVEAFADAVRAAEPGLYPLPADTGNTATTTVVTFASVFTVLLTVVAALGVFHTVLLNTRERRRDLGMLKAVGMTPRQVMVMTVTSVAVPGAVAGLAGVPLGIAGHRLIVDHVGSVAFPESMKAVWHPAGLVLLVLAGVAIAALGALPPARSAARLTIAEVLHNE
ncbi:FtsX-like permease family protein [Kitasatospora indigofera]|uniref:FtsX-like permease family protein n=1 Tax=Kitasatospora indigofera TaxID=67307 RepID=UPI00367EAD5E